MSDELLVSVSPGETRLALLDAGRLVDLFVFRAGNGSLVGNVYLGRVARVLAGMDAAFVDIGLPQAAFLRLVDLRAGVAAPAVRGERPARIGDYLHEGAAVTVQVTRDPVADKGPRVTADVTLPGRFLVYAPHHPGVTVSRRIVDAGEADRLRDLMQDVAEPGEGFILRTAAAGAERDALAAEAAAQRALWAGIAERRAASEPPALIHGELAPVARVLRDYGEAGLKRIRIDHRATLAEATRYCERVFPDLVPRLEPHDEPTSVFDLHDVEGQIAAALAPRVDLPSGAAIYIEELEALTAVDVDTGGQTGRSGAAETIFETNLEAATEIARQLRLRNIGGLIVIDFVRMDAPEYRRGVLEALRDACAADPVPVRVVGMSRVGLTEVTRRRTRDSLAAVLTEPCAACDGSGRLQSAETVALGALRALLREARARPEAALGLVTAPAVAEALGGTLRQALAEAESALGRRVDVRSDPGFACEHFEVVAE